MYKIYKNWARNTVSGDPDLLSIYCGGSFLNDGEIPQKAQLSLFKKIDSIKGLKRVLVESRPEFIEENKIRSILNMLNGKSLEIGLGLESKSDYVRNKLINKGFNRIDYENKVHLLKSLGVYVLTYIFIKPAGLTEKQAIQDTLESTDYANNIGSDEIVLEASMIQKGTKFYDFYKKGEYNPPWLWSLIEIAKRTAHMKNVRFGDFKEDPKPVSIPTNCNHCSSDILKSFSIYRTNRDISIFQKADCSCRSEWFKLMSQ